MWQSSLRGSTHSNQLGHRAILACISFSILAGCSRGDAPELDATSALRRLGTHAAKSAPAGSAVDKAAGTTAEASATAPRHERKLVRTASLQLDVESYAEARSRIDARLAQAGGYLADARVQHADGKAVHAMLELRIPATALDAFLTDAARLGKVSEENVQTREISEEYYDAQARLGNARQLEQRLLEFAATKTPDVKGLLEVERELGRVRDEIETLQGRLELFADQVVLSAVSLELNCRERVQHGEAPSLGSDLAYALSESVHGLAGTGRGILVLAASLVPWLPVLGLFYYLGRRALKRTRRRATASA